MSRPPFRDLFGRDRFGGKRSRSSSPDHARLTHLIGAADRNNLRRSFLNQVPRGLPYDIKEMIWKIWLNKDPPIPYFPLYPNRTS